MKGDPRRKRWEKEGIEMGEAITLFREDIRKFERGVGNLVKVPLHPHEFDALVSFAFNISLGGGGPTSPGFLESKTLESLNRGETFFAGIQMFGWLKPPELTTRRSLEVRLFFTGQYK